MLTQREVDILQYIGKFKVASTSTIKRLFFKDSTLRYCQIRLRLLTKDYNELNRDRHSISNEYSYYIGARPKQFSHKLMLTEFHKNIVDYVKVIQLDTEVNIGNVRPDGLLAYQVEDKKGIAFVEIDLSPNSLKEKIAKYELLYSSGDYKEYFPVFPDLIIVSNRKVPTSDKIKIIPVKADFSDITNILYKG